MVLSSWMSITNKEKDFLDQIIDELVAEGRIEIRGGKMYKTPAQLEIEQAAAEYGLDPYGPLPQ